MTKYLGCQAGEEDKTSLHLITRYKDRMAHKRLMFGTPFLKTVNLEDIGVGRLLTLAQKANLPGYLTS